jgi:glutaredoxin
MTVTTRHARRPLGLLALGLLLSACSEETKTERSAAPPPPEPIEVRAGQPDLLFTYRDPETRAFVTTSSIGSIPEAARASVVVVDLSRSPEERGSARYVQVADLREPDAEGRYPTAVASRHAFERGGAGGRGEARPSQAPVVVYAASWCGVCKKAKRVLRDLAVPFVEKDIEESRSALEELESKARAAGLRPSGVPVIDVKGRLLQGLDVPRLKATLREAGLLDA